MKKAIVSVCAVDVAFVALPVFASGKAEGIKDCLCYATKCPNVVDSFPERIEQ